MALTKVDDRGLKTPIDLQDNEKIRLGTGNDLELYHNGSHSYLDEVGTGNLNIRSEGLIELGTITGPEACLKAYANGAVELYHNNSKKLETTSYGVSTDGLMNFNGTGGKILVADEGKITFGGGNDLEIYHDGSHSDIHDSGSGNLRLRSSKVQILNEAATEQIANFIPDGPVQLYYDNDKKFETRSNGIMAMGSSGDVAVNIKAPDNISQSRVIFSDATNTDGIITYDHNDRKMHLGAGTATATDGDLIIDSSGNVGIGTTSTGSYPVSATARKVQVEIKGAINTSDNTHQGHLALNCTNASAALHIIRSENDQTNGRGIGQVIFSASDGTDIHPVASIQASRDDTGANNDQPGRLEFLTTADGASQATERMRINSDGILSLNGTYAGSSTNGYPAMLINPKVTGTDTMGIKFQARADVYDVTHIQFEHAVNQQVMGNITSANSGAVSYNTSSDYRLKENVVNLSDGITRLKTLKPKRFNFIIDETNTLVDGFLAHEVTAVPEAITGTKDQVDSDNKPVHQCIDQSKLVPLLTAALKEAIAKIETLETKVAALEAA